MKTLAFILGTVAWGAAITAAAPCLKAQTAPAPTALLLDTRKDGAPVQPTMWGIFFEDINYGADGGLYAEKVKNRSFEYPQALAGWTAYGHVEVVDSGGPFERAPRYVKLSPAGHRHKYTGIDNEGYHGVSWHGGETLKLSLWARADAPATLRVELADPAADGETVVMAHAKIKVDSAGWKKYTASLKPRTTLVQGLLRVYLAKPDTTAVDIEHISLFPAKTWRGEPGGLRRDLVQALADLKPGVFRFPGGCIVEGTDLASRYQWKNTVGPVENRPLNENRWHYTFAHRFYPDYYQSNGLGFYEYFRLAEQIGAEPLPVLSVGLACQFQNGDPGAHAPLDALEPYIRDAVDLVEFANGDTTTVWGGLRGRMGHPEPFGLKYLAIGNEQWGPEYVERLEPFVKRLRSECPGIAIVGSSGPSPQGDRFDYLWPHMRRLGADLVDEHYYCDEQWFKDNATRYDNYPRKGSKVFAGEYACHAKGAKRNLYRSALCEAAFMTGLERNADVVHMATYAPLFAHEQGWQWRPDMIWYDNLTHRLTASYRVQQLYSLNKGTHTATLTTVAGGLPLTGNDGLYGSAVSDSGSGLYIVKLVNLAAEPRTVTIDAKCSRRRPWHPVAIERTLLTASDPADPMSDGHTLATDAPDTSLLATGIELPPMSMTVLRIK